MLLFHNQIGEIIQYLLCLKYWKGIKISFYFKMGKCSFQSILNWIILPKFDIEAFFFKFSNNYILIKKKKEIYMWVWYSVTTNEASVSLYLICILKSKE